MKEAQIQQKKIRLGTHGENGFLNLLLTCGHVQ